MKIDSNTLSTTFIKEYQNHNTNSKTTPQTTSDNGVVVDISEQSQLVIAKESIKNLTQNHALIQSALEKFISQDEDFDLLHAHEDIRNLNLEQFGNIESKSLVRLNTDEANELISHNGLFNQENTINRLMQNISDIAQNDLGILYEVRESLIEGFENAEEIFGSTLSDLAHATQYQSLEMINSKIQELE